MALLDHPEFPGAEIVEAGLRDLNAGRETKEALLVAIGAPRLRALGFPLPASLKPDPEHRLYALLYLEEGNGAHSSYNALIRRLVSFERAAECAKSSAST